VIACFQGPPGVYARGADSRIQHGPNNPSKEIQMGKYFLGWLLGVPVIVLVIIYLVFN
jgi:hypothetical protein